MVQNGRLDVLAMNPLARALYAPVFADPVEPANLARFTFLDPHARTLSGNWIGVADDTVALLRTEAGRDPFDKGSPTSSASCQRAVTSSECAGQPTTCACTAPASNTFEHPVVGALRLSSK